MNHNLATNPPLNGPNPEKDFVSVAVPSWKPNAINGHTGSLVEGSIPTKKFSQEKIAIIAHECVPIEAKYQNQYYSTGEFEEEKVFIGDPRTRVEDTTLFPNCTHTYLEMTFGDDSYCGSGIMIGPNHILTCGHNVFDPDAKKWADKIFASPGASESKAHFGRHQVVKAFTLKDWINGKEEADLALLVLEEDIGHYTGWASFSALKDGEFDDILFYVSGYPGDKKERGLWEMKGGINRHSDYVLHYKISTYRGQSGSGVWKKGAFPLVAGVHVRGGKKYNEATRLSSQYFEWIRNCMELGAGKVDPVISHITEDPKPTEGDPISDQSPKFSGQTAEEPLNKEQPPQAHLFTLGTTYKCGACHISYNLSSHIPRSLPCGHTVCSNCLSAKFIVETQSLLCPLDLVKHNASRGVFTFPKDRYIIKELPIERPFGCLSDNEEEPERPTDDEISDNKDYASRFLNGVPLPEEVFTREQLVNKVENYQQNQNYKGVISCLTKLYLEFGKYTRKEAILLFAAIKETFELRRRALLKIGDKNPHSDLSREKFKQDIKLICKTIFYFFDNQEKMFNDSESIDVKISLLRIKADYCRYYVLSFPEEKQASAIIKEAHYFYHQAWKLAERELAVNSELRLSIARNYTFFLFTLTDQKENAKTLALRVLQQTEDEISILSGQTNELQAIWQGILYNYLQWLQL